MSIASKVIGYLGGVFNLFPLGGTTGGIIVRQNGGVPGTNEVQISHNGTDATVRVITGILGLRSSGTVDLQGNSGAVLQRGGGTSGYFDSFAFRLATSSINTPNSGLVTPVAGVIATSDGGAGAGWIQNTAGRAILTSNATSTSTTMANLTALSITVKSGRKYSFRCCLYVANGTPTDGVKIDFDGGSATMTSFRAHCRFFTTTPAGAIALSALATDFTVSTLTGDGFIEVDGSFVPSADGTFIPRFALNSGSTGTLTVYLGSSMLVEDMP